MMVWNADLRTETITRICSFRIDSQDSFTFNFISLATGNLRDGLGPSIPKEEKFNGKKTNDTSNLDRFPILSLDFEWFRYNDFSLIGA